MAEFFAMGGYGVYVWPAYGITLFSLALLFAWSWFGARARAAELDQLRKLARTERRSPGEPTLGPKPASPKPAAAAMADTLAAESVADLGAAPVAAAGGRASE